MKTTATSLPIAELLTIAQESGALVPDPLNRDQSCRTFTVRLVGWLREHAGDLPADAVCDSLNMHHLIALHRRNNTMARCLPPTLIARADEWKATHPGQPLVLQGKES